MNTLFLKFYRRIKTLQAIKNKYILTALCAGLLLVLINYLIIIFFGPSGDMPVAIHYNIYMGIDVFADPGQLFRLPSVGAVIYVTNLMLIILTYSRSYYLGYWLATMAGLLQLFILTALILILVYL